MRARPKPHCNFGDQCDPAAFLLQFNDPTKPAGVRVVAFRSSACAPQHIEASEEWPIPRALGGPPGCAPGLGCTPANSTIGTDDDGRIVETAPWQRLRRVFRSLCGTRQHVPSIPSPQCTYAHRTCVQRIDGTIQTAAPICKEAPAIPQ